MMKLRFIFIPLLAIAISTFGTGRIFGEDAEVKASINADKIGIDDTLLYTVTLKGVSRPMPPDISHFKDFRVVQNSQSSEFRFINGVSSYYINYLFYLSPLKTGTLTLPPVVYEYEGKQFKTQSFTVEVVKGSVGTPTAQPRQQKKSIFDMDEDFFSNPFERQTQEQAVDLKVVPWVSTHSVVKGEPILFKVFLVTRNRVRGINMISNQSFPGFWQEWFPMTSSISGESKVIDGKVYQVYEIRKAVLFPTQSGTVSIPPLKFEASLADAFAMFSNPQAISRTTPEVKIQVSELPQAAAGLPVGNFTFSVTANKKEININDVLSVKIKITGSGNIKTLGVPELPPLEYYKTYPPKITRDSSFEENSVSGVLESEIPVSFQKTGQVSIPTLTFKYYNPTGKKTVTLKSQPTLIRVYGEKEKQAGASTIPRTDIIREGEDIDYIKKGTIYNQEENFHQSKLFILLVLLPFLFNIAVLFKLFIYDRFIAQSDLLMKRKLLGRTVKNLQNLRDPGHISSILEAYLKEKTGIGLSEISNQRIDQLLETYGVSDNDIKTFLRVKTDSESWKFSPDKNNQSKAKEKLEQDVNPLIELLKRIDKKIK